GRAQGDWSPLRHTLLRMEYGGEVVRGYFVEGLSGEQYALEDTLRELETPARRAEPHVLVTIADPANLWGRVFTLTRRDGQRAAAARIPTTWLITRAGRPVLLQRPMPHSPLWLTISAVLLFGAGCAGPAASTGPPAATVPSLVEAKRQVVAYVDSGRYEADIAAVADQARTYLESRAQRGG